MVEKIDPRYFKLEMRALDGELNRWGKWIETHHEYQGYPSMNILMGFLMGRGGGTAGHRILCLEMPVEVYAVHHRVLRLSEEERDAIYAWFAIRIKDDGTLWGLSEKCSKLGIEPHVLRRRVNSAKMRIMGLCSPEFAEETNAECVAS